MDELLTISNLDALKAMASPVRLEMLKLLKEPRTVREIAAELGTPQSKLYYHINLLEEVGLVRVVATNLVSHLIEKTYQLVARNFRFDESLLSEGAPDEGAQEELLQAILDVTRRELMQTFNQRGSQAQRTPENDDVDIFRSHWRLTGEQHRAFQQQLATLLKKTEALSRANESRESGWAEYGILTLQYPLVLPLREMGSGQGSERHPENDHRKEFP